MTQQLPPNLTAEALLTPHSQPHRALGLAEQAGETSVPDRANARDSKQRSTPKAPSNALVYPRPATRVMFVAYIWTINNVVMFDLEIKHCPMTFHIAMAMDDPVIQAFIGTQGQIDELFDLQGTEARFHFHNFTSNGWIEQTPVTRIEKLGGNA